MNCSKITGDRPRQPVYEIKLMLSHVAWALISSDFLPSLPFTSDIHSSRTSSAAAAAADDDYVETERERELLV